MNKVNKVYKCCMAGIFFLFIGGIFVFHLLTPDRNFSESENRTLQQVPAFSLENLARGKFTSNYEKYISDQFPIRDYWIGIKSNVEIAMGKKENNGVYLGKDGYLIQKFIKPEEQDLKDKVGAVNHFDNATPNLNKYFMMVPTAVSVLENKLPDYAPASEEMKMVDQVKQTLNDHIRFIDVYPALSAKKNDDIFYKTDHHWTTKGAYYAYQVLSQEMGFTPKNEEDFNITKVTDAFYGSLYSKSGFRHLNPDSISLYLPKDHEQYQVEYLDGENKPSDSLYAMDHLNKKDKYAVFLNGNYSLIKITTGNEEGKKLLMVKDSYANCFIPFLALHFNEIYVVDLRYYTDNLMTLIQNNQINDMILLYNSITFFEDPFIKNLSE